MQNANRVKPIIEWEQVHSPDGVRSPMIGKSNILTLKRGKTLIQQDTSFLMPIPKNQISQNQIVPFQPMPNIQRKQVSVSPQLGIAMGRKQSFGDNLILNNNNNNNLYSDYNNNSSKMGSPSNPHHYNYMDGMSPGIKSILQRKSTVKQQHDIFQLGLQRQQSSMSNQKPIKSILKKSATIIPSRNNTPSPNMRKIKEQRSPSNSTFKSSNSSVLTKYRRKFIQEQNKKKSLEMRKSKDIFNVLKSGAFQDTDNNISNLAALHLMDLNRIARQSTIRSNKSKKSILSMKKSSRSRKSNNNSKLKNLIRSATINPDFFTQNYVITPPPENNSKIHEIIPKPFDFSDNNQRLMHTMITNFSAQKTKNNNVNISNIANIASATLRQKKQKKQDENEEEKSPKLKRKKTLHFRSRKFGEELSQQKNSKKHPEYSKSDNQIKRSKPASFHNQSEDQSMHRAQTMARQNSMVRSMIGKNMLDKIEEIKQELITQKVKLKQEIRLQRRQTILRKQKLLDSGYFIKRKQNCCQKLFKANEFIYKNNEDSDITSDDCEDNGYQFSNMGDDERGSHLQDLWRKTYIKARAGVNVINLFNDLNRKIYLFGISRGLNDLENNEVIPFFIIMPSDLFRVIWNIIVILLLFYTAIFTPFKVAFIDKASLFSDICDYIVDGLFFFDIIVTFFSAFEEYDGSIQHRLPIIAKTYIKSNFLIDVFAIFPFQDALQTSSGASYQKLLRLMRLPRLFRMLKIMKILKQIHFLRSSKIFNKFLKMLSMNTAIIRMIQGMSAALIITHLFACFFFMTAKFDDFNPDTWVFRMGILDADYMNQYLYALYWATQTVITVGYGDINLVSPSEMALSLVWMIFGVGFYSFIIGNFSSIISGNIQIQATILLKIKSLGDLARKAQIPLELLRKIKKFIINNYEAIYNQEDETQLIKMLPPSLRDEVLSNTYGEVIEKVQFFRNLKDPDFLWKLLPLLRPMKLEKGDILYWRGDHADDLYFIMKGQIKLYTEKGYPYIKYSEGDLFGDSDTLLNLPRDGKAIAMTHLKLMVLKVDQMFEKTFENQEKNFMEMIFSARIKRNNHLRLIAKANMLSKRRRNKNQKRNDQQSRDFGDSAIYTEDHKISHSQIDTPKNAHGHDAGFLGGFTSKIMSSLFKGSSTEEAKIERHRSAYEKIIKKKNDKMNIIQSQERSSDQSNPMGSFNFGDSITSINLGNLTKIHNKKKEVISKLSSTNLGGIITMNPQQAAVEVLFKSKLDTISKNPQNTQQQNNQQQLQHLEIFPNTLFPPQPKHEKINIVHSPKNSIHSKENSTKPLQRQLSIIQEYKKQPTRKASAVIQKQNIQNKIESPELKKYKQQSFNIKSSMQNNTNNNNNNGDQGIARRINSLHLGYLQKDQNSAHDDIIRRDSQNIQGSQMQSSQVSELDLIIERFEKGKQEQDTFLTRVLTAAYNDAKMQEIYKKYSNIKDNYNEDILYRKNSILAKNRQQTVSPRSPQKRESIRKSRSFAAPIIVDVFRNSLLEKDQSKEQHEQQNQLLQINNINENTLYNVQQQQQVMSPNKPKKQSLFAKKQYGSQVVESNRDKKSSNKKKPQTSSSGSSIDKDSLEISIFEINQQIERLNEKEEQKQIIDLNDASNKNSNHGSSRPHSSRNGDHTKPSNFNSRLLNMPKIIIQEKLTNPNQKSSRNGTSKHANVQELNYNNLTPIRIAKHNFDKTVNSLQNAQKKHNSLTMTRKTSSQNMKSRTSSVRIIAAKPSFVLLKEQNNSQYGQIIPQQQNQRIYKDMTRQNRFISPIAIQRICSMDPAVITNLKQKISQIRDIKNMKNNSISPLTTLYSKKSKKIQIERASTNKNNEGKHSISEVVSIAVQNNLKHKQSLLLNNLKSTDQNNLTINQTLKNVLQNVSRNQEQQIKQNHHSSFTDMVNSLQEEEKVSSQNLKQQDSQYQLELQRENQMKYLDDLLLNNQTEEYQVKMNKMQSTQTQQLISDQQSEVPSMKYAILEEIKRRFSRNLDQEIVRFNSQAALAKYQTQFSNQNNNNNKNNNTLQNQIQTHNQYHKPYINVLDQTQNSFMQQQIITRNPSQNEPSFAVNTNFMQTLGQSNNINNVQKTDTVKYQQDMQLKSYNQSQSSNNSVSILEQESSININHDNNTKPVSQGNSSLYLGLHVAQNQQQQEQQDKKGKRQNQDIDDPFQDEQEIEYYGDPAMLGLVQLNEDMGHIAMNIFETFTIFDLINKTSKQYNESFQNIQSQNSIIYQRQDNVDRKLDEIEQQLLIIKQMKQYKSTTVSPLDLIPQEIRY